MIILYYFTQKVLKGGFRSILESHLINHINSKFAITSKYLENGKIHINNIVKKMARTLARLLNEHKFK